MYKKISFIFSFFVIFLLIFTSFLIISVDAKTDTHLSYAGGVIALAYVGNEHIVSDNHNLACAFVGYDGDSSFVQFVYSEDSGFWWTVKPIRETTNTITHVSIARDSDFNIHAIYREFNGSTANVYYKVFNWEQKLWYDMVGGSLSPSTDLGYAISDTSYHGYVEDIKVDTFGNVHVIYSELNEAGTTFELIYARYDNALNSWDLVLGLDSEVTTESIYYYSSLALDSYSHLYLTYGRKQDAHFDEIGFYDVWFTKSINGGDSWSSPSQLVNATYPYSVAPNKLLIDNTDIVYLSYSFNASAYPSMNKRVAILKSTNYGSTWSVWKQITTPDTHCLDASISLDSNNVFYITYNEKADFNSSYFDIKGVKIENDVVGDIISLVNKSGSSQEYLTLVYSNTYNQYANSGIMGIYQDRVVANYDIRYLVADYDDFMGKPSIFKWDFIPDKDIYLVYDTLTLRQTTYTQNAFWNRIVDANGDFVFYPEFYWTIGGKDTVFTIPSGFLNGTWVIETYVTNDYFYPPDWGVDSHYETTFEVRSSHLDYYISSSKYYVTMPDSIDITFSAYEGDSYILQLVHENQGVLSNITIPEVGADQDYLYSNAFTLYDIGRYHVKLINASNDFVFAITDGIKASEYPEIPTYTSDLKQSYGVHREYAITLFSDSIKQYKYEFFDPFNEIVETGVYSGARGNRIKIIFDEIGIGYSLFIYDVDGSKYDVNVYYKEFEVKEISIVEDNYQTFIALVVILLFTFMGFGLAIKAKQDVAQITLVFAIIGVLIATILELIPSYVIFILGILLLAFIVKVIMEKRG